MNALKSRTGMMLLACGLTVCCLAVAGSVWAVDDDKAPAAKPTAARWQHLVLTHDLRPEAAKQNVGAAIIKLGQDGWELVSVANVTQAGTTTKTVFYFKRRL